jgi:hypothetical protein
MTLRISAIEKPWHEAFRKFNIEYGYSNVYHKTRNQNVLGHRKRAASSTPTTTLDLTSIIPTETPTRTLPMLNLAHKETDTTFSLPVQVGPPLPISLGCKRCETTGSMKLTYGSFNVDINSDNVASPQDYITGGMAKLEMNDFSAFIQLQIMPSLTGSLPYQLFSIPIYGFAVRLFHIPMSRFNLIDILRRYPMLPKQAYCLSLC